MLLKRAKIILSGKPMSIWFRHPNVYGVSLIDVAAKWIEETENDFSAESLVNYINEKMPNTAMTEDQFATIPDSRKRFRN